MAIGLKRGIVELTDHDPEWEQIARDTIGRLWRVFGSAAKDIQHVGSTAIKGIKAKPIIDIAVAADDFAEVEKLTPALETEGFLWRKWENEQRMLFAVGDYVNPDGLVTHFIHVMKPESEEWFKCIGFRDYLNAHISAAKEYEALKVRLANENPIDPGREKYVAGKNDFITKILADAQIWTLLRDIPEYNSFVKIEAINKGLSSDLKYYIETADGRRLLLRVNDIKECDSKKIEHERMQRMDAAGVPMSRPVSIGTCNDGKSIYQLTTWCDGENLEKMIPLLSETEQYITGLKVGIILRKIHSVSASEITEDWLNRYTNVIGGRIQAFYDCGVRLDGWENIIRYYEDNRHLLKNRPQVLLHGDFHAENLLLADNGDISVIDWQVLDFEGYGDPWVDFRSDLCAVSPHYTTGCINGYFDNEVPDEFWKLNAFYMATGSITAIPWAFYRHNEFLDELTQHCINILRWFDNMNNPVPMWYLKDFYVQWIDGIPYKLKASFDFSFMAKYGKVFKVFDEQGSGNIAFGVQSGVKKYFIKFAGAPKENYIANRDSGAVDAASAIESLIKAIPIYSELAHPTMIKFIEAEEIGGGYAAVFEWEDAVGIEPKGSPDYMRFMQMPTEKKIQAFEEITAFHAHVAARGYVALDFYDGSILYNYENEKVIICDIDLYQKSPFQNVGNLGIVGSARYVSPEECVPDAVMDEITNVYTMGATAFALFAYGDRSPEAWPLNMALYDVATKAISDDRNQRQQSIEQFIKEWRVAK